MDKPRILIVDDDDSITSRLKIILEAKGYIVDTASTGKEAVQKTEEESYNIALLDIRLPDMEGIELLNIMKDNVPKMRKIMVTGYPSIQNAVTSLNRKADAYLIKPVSIETLLATIRDQLRQQKEEKTFSEARVAEFIESRMKEIPVKRRE